MNFLDLIQLEINHVEYFLYRWLKSHSPRGNTHKPFLQGKKPYRAKMTNLPAQMYRSTYSLSFLHQVVTSISLSNMLTS